MRKLKNRFNRTITIVMEAGVFFLSLASPVFAQLEGGIGGGASSAQPDNTPADLFGQQGLFKKVANILVFLIGAVSVIMLIIGGFRYVISGGDSAGVEGAKNTILYAIVGIVVAFLAYAAVNFVINSLQS